jgi:hypothetical protein
MGNDNRLVHAAIGAVVTIVTAFLPFSPILGGGVAAYFGDANKNEGLRIGAVSGAIGAFR